MILKVQYVTKVIIKISKKLTATAKLVNGPHEGVGACPTSPTHPFPTMPVPPQPRWVGEPTLPTHLLLAK